MMLNPDFIEPAVAIPVIVVLWGWWFVSSILHAPVNTTPGYSDLDTKDGLGSHLDVTG
jgi:hypothetical protein